MTKFSDDIPNDLIPHAERPYRAGVGIVLFNAKGLVFVGERLDHSDSWQMPQGGIDGDETPEQAALRELEEEVGTGKAKFLDEMDEWLFYDIPLHTSNKLWDGQFRGQKQKWLAFEFLGQDSDIDLNAHNDPEFGQWKWIPIEELMNFAVVFKRDMYKKIIDEFQYISSEFHHRHTFGNK